MNIDLHPCQTCGAPPCNRTDRHLQQFCEASLVSSFLLQAGHRMPTPTSGDSSPRPQHTLFQPCFHVCQPTAHVEASFSNDTGQFRYSVVSTDRIRWPHLLSCLFTSFFEPAVGHFSTARLAACRPGISALVGSGLVSPRASGSPLAHSTDSQEAPNTRLMLGDRPFLQPTPMWLVCTAYCIFSRWRPMFS